MKNEEMRESPRGRSMLNLYRQCPRRWAFKYIKGFTPLETSDPLTLGSAIHETQALFYQGEHILKCYDFLSSFLKERKSLHLEKKALAMMTSWYNTLGISDREERIPLAVEVEAPVILPNNFEMSVRWDRVLLEKSDGEIFINDTKTTSGNPQKVIQTYNYSDQPKLYILSVIQSRPEWLKQFHGWRTDVIYGRELKAGKINTDIQRSEIVMFSKPELDDVLKSYASLTDDIAFKLEAVAAGDNITTHFSATSDFCYSYGRVCPYKPFCHEIDTIEEPPANFKIDPWLKKGIIKEAFKSVEV